MKIDKAEIKKIDIKKPEYSEFNPKVDYPELKFKKPFPDATLPKDMKPVKFGEAKYKKITYR